MPRLFIAVCAVLFASVGSALDSRTDMPMSAYGPVTIAAGWYSEDVWGIVAAVVAMLLVIRRRDR